MSKSDSPIIAGNALDEATRKAEALMKEDAAKYPTIEQARAHIWASNADLKKRYDDERKQAH